MLGLDFFVMMGALVFFFLRSAQDADREEARAAAAEGSTPVTGQRSPHAGTF